MFPHLNRLPALGDSIAPFSDGGLAQRLSDWPKDLRADRWAQTQVCPTQELTHALSLRHCAARGVLALVVLNVDIRQPCYRPNVSSGPGSLLPLVTPVQRGGPGGTNRACISHGQWLHVEVKHYVWT